MPRLTPLRSKPNTSFEGISGRSEAGLDTTKPRLSPGPRLLEQPDQGSRSVATTTTLESNDQTQHKDEQVDVRQIHPQGS